MGGTIKARCTNIYALDRIISLRSLTDEPYIRHEGFDVEKYFSEMIGVTRNDNDKPQIVKFWASPMDSPYFITKPLHHTQEIEQRNENGETLFSINVIINRELMRVLLGFGPGVKVIAPSALAAYIQKCHQDAAEGILKSSS